MNKILFFILLQIIILPVFAENVFDLRLVNNQNLDEKLKFLDNLYYCVPTQYHAQPTGYYEVYGKKNEHCSIRWTIAYCDFPPNVYPEFADIQKKRALNRAERELKGIRIEEKDKDYRYLLNVGNRYCVIKY